MCGRFTLHHSVDELAKRFGVDLIQTDVPPSYNVAPTQRVAVVTGNQERSLQSFVWGLVPFWAKDPSIGNRMINARAETIAEKPAYKNAFQRRRCLIPADGFFEWKKEGKAKTPMYIRFPDSRLFAFAGIWERWSPPNGEPLDSCAIITVDPNEMMSSIHDRMPAILEPGAEAEWLDADNRDPVKLQSLLHSYPDGELVASPVSRRVNSPANNDDSCIASMTDDES
jgi:putative SOS response-associated peptidase YedK